jgi:hypothetical protein
MYQSIVSFTLKIENFIRTADTYWSHGVRTRVMRVPRNGDNMSFVNASLVVSSKRQTSMGLKQTGVSSRQKVQAFAGKSFADWRSL